MKHYLSERRWVLIFAFCVLLVTSIPYGIGFLRQGNGWQFTGFVMGVEDGNSYLAKMANGARGDWLFRTPYTTFPQRGLLAFLPYLLLGKLSSPPGDHTQLILLYQAFRWLGGVLFILASYDLTACFFTDRRLQKIGTVLITLGGGLGWLSFFGLSNLWQNGLPLDFYSPETFGFLEIYGLPHLAFGRALLLWGLVFLLSSLRQPSHFPPWLGGVLWLLMGLMQPLTVVSGWIVAGLFLISTAILGGIYPWEKNSPPHQAWRSLCVRTVWMVGLSSPIVVLTGFSLLTDPFFKAWSRQNIILSPPVLDYLMAYGIFLPLVIAGAWRSLKDTRRDMPESWKWYLLTGWVVLFPFLAYAPLNIQRRLPEGVWCAVILLALKGLSILPARWGKILQPSLAGLSLLSSIFLIAGGCIMIWLPALPLYRPSEEISTFYRLQEIAAPQQIVLASFNTSNALPAWVSLRTVIGHGPESPGGEDLKQRVERFFSPETSDRERYSLLKEYQPDYIWYGPLEKALGNWKPSSNECLTLVIQQGQYSVYQYNVQDCPVPSS